MPPATALTPSVECGLAGSTKDPSLVGKLEALQFGAYRVPSPLTVFYRQTAERWYDGLLGNQAFANFKVIFDCPRSKMFLEPL